MKVLKFGGTSVGTADMLHRVLAIVAAAASSEQIIVVVSALSGITNALEHLAEQALVGDHATSEILENIRQRHHSLIEELLSVDRHEEVKQFVSGLCDELQQICTGVGLVDELSVRSRARLMSAGELMSSKIIAAFFAASGLSAQLKDARDFVITSGDPLSATVDEQETYRRLGALIRSEARVMVLPGFIARDRNGNTSTLGRGGSDYTASLTAAACQASVLEIWTDVNGVMTADPRLVQTARPVVEMTYEEAMELSFFGAKVIYPPTIQPLVKPGIPLRIKNTNQPDAPGTLIMEKTGKAVLPVKGISCITEIALVTVAGAGMIGVPGTAMRMFGAVSRKALNVLFITQSSSEHTITIGLKTKDARKAADELTMEFDTEIQRNQVDPVTVEEGLAIVAAVGDDMKNRPGLAGKLFGLIGENGINIRAIAQGSTERNVSFVIRESDARKALNVIHEGFFLSPTRVAHIFCVGVGNVGSNVLQQLRDQAFDLKRRQHIEIKVSGIANSTKMVFNEDGFDLDSWQSVLDQGEAYSPHAFCQQAEELNLRNSIFIDNTASADVAATYKEVLGASIHVVTSNKIAASAEYAQYQQLKQMALRRGVQFLYETNVAAGLPVIRTIQDMMMTGDRIHRIDAVLSGSLNYIFNHLSSECPFSKAVAQARELGLTEPDPAVDLSGMDVKRKILILAREAGLEMEIHDVGKGHMVPERLETGMSWEQLYSYLQSCDDAIAEDHRAVTEAGRKWRFMATLIDGIASVGVLSIGAEHPAWVLDGKDNLVMIYSDRYREEPMVVRGAGAGPRVTASGVLADILRIVNV